MHTRTPRILFMQMPWATTQRPSIALGILTNICKENGVEVKTMYPNMDMADLIGFEAASRFANERALYGLSEHMFAADLFGADALKSDEYLLSFSNILKGDSIVKDWSFPIKELDYMLQLRNETIPKFLDAQLGRVLEYDPTVVGFSATFNQVMPGLALAARIKRLRPEITIVAGGASYDSDMGLEYHRALPDIIDHVFIGESEDSFREFLKQIKTGEPVSRIPGLTSMKAGKLLYEPGQPLADMNESPIPDYSDFFSEAERIRKASGKIFNVQYLSFEGSRGCWWGNKSQCLFCGINPKSMVFRPKTVDRIVQDILTLSHTYRVNKLSATDLVISKSHCDELFARMKELDFDIDLFFEVRVDMTKKQIQNMFEAGVTNVQPGIESFSTPVLKIMRKGSTALKNIQFLRWISEIGIAATYNILAGFPEEQESWYFDMAALIKKLVHLPPPKFNMHFIEMHRFSPFYDQQERFGVDECSLRSDYSMNFPEGKVDSLKIGYFFQTKYKVGDFTSPHIKAVRDEIEHWRDFRYKKRQLPVYNYSIGPGFINIYDERFEAPRYVALADLHHDVALLCDEIQTRHSLKTDLAQKWPDEVRDGILDAVVNELVEREILLEENGQLLLLPIGVKFRDTTNLREYILS